MPIASFIDHTILKPTTATGDIKNICSEALNYGFAAVCIPPYFIREAVKLVEGSEVKVATVIGFPFGYSYYKAKLAEVEQAIADKADEVDMVMNLAAFKDGNEAYLQNEISSLLALTKKAGVAVKVIIESGILTNEEIIRCCKLYSAFEIDFLKTSTGYAEKGASVEAVALMRQNLPFTIQIKASGGIKTFDFASQLLKAGATRLGCSASVAIVTGEKASGEGY